MSQENTKIAELPVWEEPTIEVIERTVNTLTGGGNNNGESIPYDS